MNEIVKGAIEVIHDAFDAIATELCDGRLDIHDIERMVVDISVIRHMAETFEESFYEDLSKEWIWNEQ